MSPEAECRSCGEEWSTNNLYDSCPECGSQDIELSASEISAEDVVVGGYSPLKTGGV